MTHRGLAQIPLMIGLLLMAVALPVATKLVQDNQENRGQAASTTCGKTYQLCCNSTTCDPGLKCSLMPGGRFCIPEAVAPTNTPKPVNPTATPATRTCTWKTCEITTCRTHTEQRPYSQACPSSNCTTDAGCRLITPTSLPTASCRQENDTCIVDSNCCRGLVCSTDFLSQLSSCEKPCKTNGATTSVASDCCSGYAAYSGSSLICGTRPTATPTQRPCVPENSTCTSGNLCCDNNVCRQNGELGEQWACLPPLAPTQVPIKPCCCNSGDMGTNCFWSDIAGRCHTTQSVDSWLGAYARPVTDTSKCGGVNPNPTCTANYASCATSNCCKDSNYECRLATGGKWCLPKPGVSGTPICTNGTTKCELEFNNTSYEYKCVSGSWVKDKRCDGACKGIVCASFTKCTPGEKRCNTTTSSFETCSSVGTWGGTYCPNGCNSSGCNTTTIPSISPTTTGVVLPYTTTVPGKCANSDPCTLPIVAEKCAEQCCGTGHYYYNSDHNKYYCGSKPEPTGINPTNPPSECSGKIAPPDQCPVSGNPNQLGVNASCITLNGQKIWDWDLKLCDQKGKTSACGIKNYCCPSVGGNWTTDMTQCPITCTQCAGKPEAKGKGDADCSGTTDINDASIWRSEFTSGQLGTEISNSWRADFDCDGKVTLNDISIWRENFIKGLTN